MDMSNTIEAIIDASHLPMSILIVGIGRDEFTKMNVSVAGSASGCVRVELCHARHAQSMAPQPKRCSVSS